MVVRVWIVRRRARIVVRLIVVEVADRLGDMVIVIAYGQLREMAPLTSSEARACVSAPG